MNQVFASLLKTLRTERGYSQAFVAEKLGISRASYIVVEQGGREVTLVEAERLGKLFGVSLEEFVGGVVPQYEKYKQMILAFLQLPSSSDGKVPKTKLAKLLYLADFGWYYDHLVSMSGMPYVRRAYGPVPDPFFRALGELEEDGKIAIDHKGDALLVSLAGASSAQKLDLLSTDEKKLLHKISLKWQKQNTRSIVDFTHEQLPYKLCAPDEIIPYELIIQQDPGYVY